jgi:hypothetical protein
MTGPVFDGPIADAEGDVTGGASAVLSAEGAVAPGFVGAVLGLLADEASATVLVVRGVVSSSAAMANVVVVLPATAAVGFALLGVVFALAGTAFKPPLDRAGAGAAWMGTGPMASTAAKAGLGADFASFLSWRTVFTGWLDS